MLGVSIVLFVVLLAVLFAVAAVTAGFGDLMKPVFQDARPVGLPDGQLKPGDLDDLRFNVVLRGYKMSEVDAVLHRMARELAERDAVLAELRGDTTLRRGLPVPPQQPDELPAAPAPYEPLPSYEAPAAYELPPLAVEEAPTELIAPVEDDTQSLPAYEAPPLPTEPPADHG